MTNNSHQQSARIYAFPVGGRASRDAANRPAVLATQIAAKRVADVSFDAWYHQDAIDEESHEAKQ